MKRLLHTELTRLRWRRAVLVLMLLALALPLLLLAGEAWNTRPISEADLAQAQVEIDAMNAENERYIAECLDDPESYGIDPERAEQECEGMYAAPTPEEWLFRPTLDLASVREGAGLALVTILALVAGVVGTTFVGHDWASGSMSNQLLFEPRRARVWLAKALAVVLGTVVVAAVSILLFWAGAALVAQVRDIETSADTWSQILATQARGLVLIGSVGLGGYALTTLLRSTVASLGVLFGAVVVSSMLLAILLGVNAERWLLPTNVFAFVLGGYDYYTGNEVSCDADGNCTGMSRLHTGQAAIYLACLVVPTVVASLWSFRRRDVP